MPVNTNIDLPRAIERLEALTHEDGYNTSLIQTINALFGSEDWNFLNVRAALLVLLKRAYALEREIAPLGADGQPIAVGQTVYGEDGAAWEVIGVTCGRVEYPIVGRGSGGQKREMKSEWLTHSKPTMESTLRDFARDVAAELGRGGGEASERLVDKYAKKVNRIMNRSKDRWA
jgi:hypothetical protein